MTSNCHEDYCELGIEHGNWQKRDEAPETPANSCTVEKTCVLPYQAWTSHWTWTIAATNFVVYPQDNEKRETERDLDQELSIGTLVCFVITKKITGGQIEAQISRTFAWKWVSYWFPTYNWRAILTYQATFQDLAMKTALADLWIGEVRRVT